MEKILILYASYGGGHLSAANSIKNYIEKNYADKEVLLVDCIKYVNKPLEKITTDAYKRITKSAPWAWKKVYYNSEKGALSRISNTTNKIIAKKLYNLFLAYNPDLVISTHPFATQMTSYLKKKVKINCQLATILTDFAPHDQWLTNCSYGDYFFVSNENMRNILTTYYCIDKDKVFVTGIPISERFQAPVNKQEVYDRLNLDSTKKTILFFGGGEFGLGKETTIHMFKLLVKHIDTYQIIAISGKNKKMNSSFNEVYESVGKPKEIKIFEFVDFVPDLMSISSLVVTKAGGLTISESLAKHLPIIVINPLPGQEEENAQYLVDSGAAVWIKKDDDAELILNTILNSPEKLEEMKNNSKNISHINAAENICTILFKKICQ